jgi:hypothetical protein
VSGYHTDSLARHSAACSAVVPSPPRRTRGVGAPHVFAGRNPSSVSCSLGAPCAVLAHGFRRNCSPGPLCGLCARSAPAVLSLLSSTAALYSHEIIECAPENLPNWLSLSPPSHVWLATFAAWPYTLVFVQLLSFEHATPSESGFLLPSQRAILIFSGSCTLFCLGQDLNPRIFKRLRAPWPKLPGGGPLLSRNFPVEAAPSRNRPPLRWFGGSQQVC